MKVNIDDKMKNIKVGIKTLIKQQQNLINEYNSLIEHLDEDKVIHENINLKSQVMKLENELRSAKTNFDKSLNENQELKYLIQGYIVQDKIKYLNISKDKLSLYFTKDSSKTFNELELLELKMRKRIKEFNTSIKSEANQNFTEFMDSHHKILIKLQNQILEYRKTIKEEKERFQVNLNQELDGLNSKKVDKKELKKYINKNSLELKLGSSWINKIGILFILIGVGTAFKYTYSKWFTPIIKSCSFFALGILFIAAGEYFSQKRKTQFSLGFLGGGIAILYLSTFFCHFFLGTIGLNTAIIFTCVITGISLLLSFRHKSQTICSLGLIGGNFPIITYFIYYPWNNTSIITAMVYSCILNAVVLIFAYRFKWQIVNYISFLASNIAMFFLTLMISISIIGIIYSLIIFFIFNFLIILQLKAQQRNLNFGDFIIVTLNILINSCIVYLLCHKISPNIAGKYSASYSLFYLLFGLLTTYIIKHEKKISLIFYGASIIFAILFIPLQFNLAWLGFGWLVEGVIFTLIGLKLKSFKLQICGLVVFIVALVIFYTNIGFYKVIICSNYIPVNYFFLKYSCSIIGECIILAGYILSNRMNSFKYPFSKIFEISKAFVVISLYFYIQYYFFKLFGMTIPETFHFETKRFFSNLLYLIILSIYIKTIFKYKEFSSEILSTLRTLLSSLLMILALSLMISKPIIYIGTSAYYLNYIGFILLVSVNIMAIISIYSELSFWREKTFTIYKYIYTPEVISILSAIVLISALVVQLKLPYNSIILTTAILIYGTINIHIGLKKYFVLLRRIGLITIFITTAKLFLIDITFNKIEYKIISYFVFGIVFILISYIYQKTKIKFDNIIEKQKLSSKNENNCS